MSTEEETPLLEDVPDWPEARGAPWFNLYLNGFFLFAMLPLVLGSLGINIYWFTLSPFDMWSIWPLIALVITVVVWLALLFHWIVRVWPGYTRRYMDMMETKPEARTWLWSFNFDKTMKIISIFGLVICFVVLGATLGLITYVVAGDGQCALHSICDSFLSIPHKCTVAWLAMQYALLVIILGYSALKWTELVGANEWVIRITDGIAVLLFFVYGLFNLIVFLFVFIYNYDDDAIMWEFLGWLMWILLVAGYVFTHELMDIMNLEKTVVKEIRQFRILAFGAIVLGLMGIMRMWAHYLFGNTGCDGYSFCLGSPNFSIAVFITTTVVLTIGLWVFFYRVISEGIYSAQDTKFTTIFDLGSTKIGNTVRKVAKRVGYRGAKVE